MVASTDRMTPASSPCRQEPTAKHIKSNSTPRTVDELLRLRAQTMTDVPLVSYPDHGLEYIDYSARQLDQYACHVAKQYAAILPTRTDSHDKPVVVGLLGLSSLDYLISAMAVVKLGHTALHLSTRISHEAYVGLLVETETVVLLADEMMYGVAAKCTVDVPHLQVQTMSTSAQYIRPVSPNLDTNLTPGLDLDAEQDTVAWIIHSSGSTGLPKPIYQTQAAAINNYRGNMGMRGFVTLPLFHAHGLSSTYRAIYSGKQIHIYNAKVPLTKQYLIELMRRFHFEIFYGVPYVLKLLAEDQQGIELLARCKIVMFGGSSCPDPLGDKLVENGVNLVSHWGSTETGQLMTSFRPRGDTAWNYLRPSDSVQPYLRMEDRGEGLFEAVCLPGWPSKVATNRADGSYAMKDLFTKHPQQNWWKYYGRLDDTIVLVNGEKAMPLPIEGAARQHPLVSEAVVVGRSRDRLGLVLIRAPSSAGVATREVAQNVLASIENVQSTMPAYARITHDMVLVLDTDTDYPHTDKGTVVRMKFYKRFEREIDALYNFVDNHSGTLELDEGELRTFLRSALQASSPDLVVVDDEQDFFNAGMDSLLASRLRAAIVKDVALGENVQLGMNVAFEYPSISRLARYLYALRTGGFDGAESFESVEEQMQRLVDKYSTMTDLPAFEPLSQISHSDSSQANAVVLTGATGSLGAHVAAILIQNPAVTNVYCLIRASSVSQAQSRLAASFAARDLPVISFNTPCEASSPSSSSSSSTTNKLIALPSDLTRPDLGLDESTLSLLRRTTKTIIHSAWSVNFNLSLSSFEDCIRSTHNLLQFATSTAIKGSGGGVHRAAATFNFCSSVSTVMNTAAATATSPTTDDNDNTSDESGTPKCRIPETIPPLSHAQSMGYAQSKLVTEHVCRHFAHDHNREHTNSIESTSFTKGSSTSADGSRTRILRIGQIIGDTTRGIWNHREAIPCILQSSDRQSVGALPTLDEELRWLPVDVVAQACVDISLSHLLSPGGEDKDGEDKDGEDGDGEDKDGEKCRVYNVINPNTIHWTRDLLPMVVECVRQQQKQKTEFEVVSIREWLDRLRNSNPDPVVNPPIKLLDFWTEKYGSGKRDRTDNNNNNEIEQRQKRVEYVWACENATTASPVLRSVDRETVLNVVKLSLIYFQTNCW